MFIPLYLHTSCGRLFSVTCITVQVLTLHAVETEHDVTDVIEVTVSDLEHQEHLSFEYQADEVLAISNTTLQKAGVTSINDLRRIDPRIATISNRERGRNEGIQLRGLSGNRVSSYLDGIPLGDALGELFEVSMLNNLQVHFGPSSSRRASGALGGHIDYYFKRPRDLLQGRKHTQEIHAFASSLNDSVGLQYSYATQLEDDAALIAINAHGKHELAAVGAAQSWPQDRLALSALAVYTQTLHADAFIDYTFDFYHEGIDTIIRDDYLFEDRADDTRLRARLSTHYQEFNDDQELIRSAQLYIQRAETLDQTISLDFGNQDSGFDRRRVAENEFEQNLLGAFYHRQTNISQNVRGYYGGDILLTQSADLQSGHTSVYSIDSYSETDPTRSFPETRALTAGIYSEWQRDIEQWTLGGGLRFDIYQLRLDVDEAYERSLAGVNAPTDLDDAAATARINIIKHFNDAEHIYLKLAQGYRNGRYDEANHAFTNFTNGYTLSPNPDLSPEVGLTFEIGYKNTQAFECAAHYTWYEDFITSQFVGTIPNNTGIGPHSTFAQYQSINIDRVHIYGFDLKGQHSIHDNYDVIYAAAWIDGADSETDADIDELQPLRAQIGLRRYALNGTLEIECLLRYAQEKQNVERNDAFIPESFTVLDARILWKPSARLQLALNVENIFNKHYWEWSDVSSLSNSSSDAEKDYYAAYPFHCTLSSTFTW